MNRSGSYSVSSAFPPIPLHLPSHGWRLNWSFGSRCPLALPECKPVDAPPMAVPPEPLLVAEWEKVTSTKSR